MFSRTTLPTAQPSRFSQSRAPRRRRTTRRGATAVEFAVVAPLFFLMVLGAVEFGRGLMCAHLLTNAARQGCRQGVIDGKTNSDVSNAVAAALSDVGINAASTAVQVQGSTGDVAAAQSGDKITVVVTVPMKSVSWLPVDVYLSGNLTGQWSLQRE